MLDACAVPQKDQEMIFSGTMRQILQRQKEEIAASRSADQVP
jgi:hypothetical protein